ncbi:MAG: adenylate/guanylate cyclase domain-containing protein [Chloroflexota bacterium]
MSLHILVAQPNSQSTQTLTNSFTEQGETVWQTEQLAEAQTLLTEGEIELLVVNLHLLADEWCDFIEESQQQYPDLKILYTINYPDPQQELIIKQRFGEQVFLRQPFTQTSIEQALRTLEGAHPIQDSYQTQAINLPKVQIPVRLKITLPYVVLALLLALAAAYLINQVVFDTIEERFTNQLIEAGKLTSDFMVVEESRLLETLRLVANTKGFADAVVVEDAELLRELVLPVAINYQEEAVEILTMEGLSILSLRHRPENPVEVYDFARGETFFQQWHIVQNVLTQQVNEGRDKFGGVLYAPWGDYVYIAGPIFDDTDTQVGIILVGKSLPTLVRQMRNATLAHTTIYDFDGSPSASTFFAFADDIQALDSGQTENIVQRQEEESLTRPATISSIDYQEIMGVWEIGSTIGSNDLGIIGVALPETFLVQTSQVTRLQIFLLTAVTFLLVIALGLYLANRITRPLLKVVEASTAVSRGNLDVQVDAAGNDEVAVLGHSFNQMVSGLQEGSIYRDLFGRTVSPEVREQLRQGFATGDVRLEGQETMAAILVSDIRGFTTLSESEAPETILNWLNEYFDELIPVITAQGGVISKFEGDALLAFFGILPRPISPEESAYRACQAALGILDAVDRLNARRVERGVPPFVTGVGLNIGPVTAGGLGGSDRLHYTVIGDTVNTTTRLEGLSRQFGEESSAILSHHILFALRDRRHEFELEPMGAHNFKGKAEKLLIYRLEPTNKAINPSEYTS